MELSDMLISQFVKATNDDSGIRGETTAYGTIVVHDDAQYVVLDGSIYKTPIVSTTEVNENDRVLVRLKNHTAMVTDNLTHPSIGTKRAGELESKISQTASEIRAEVKSETDGIKTSITQTASEIRAEVKSETDGIKSSITQTASDIRAEVKSETDGIKTSIAQTASDIRAEVKSETDGIKTSITQTAEAIRSEITDGIDGLRSEIKQTTDGITATVKDNNDAFSEFKQTIEGFSFMNKGGTVKISGGDITLTGSIKFEDFGTDVKNTINTASSNASTAISKADAASTAASTAQAIANSASSTAGNALINANSAAEAAAVARAIAESVQLPSYLTSTYIGSTTIMSPSIVGGTFYAAGQNAWATMSSDGFRVYTGGISTPKIELLNYNNAVELVLGSGDSSYLGRFQITKNVDNVVLRYDSPTSVYVFSALVFGYDGSIVARRGLTNGNTTSITII